MKKQILGFLLMLCMLWAAPGTAQDWDSAQIAKPRELEKKTAPMSTFSLGKGKGITAPDSTFQINMKFRMQNRMDANFGKGQATSYQGMVRRARLSFEGFVFDPKLTYKLQFSFSSKDVGDLDGESDFNSIYDAAVFYKPNKRWNLIFGQTKLPGNRQRLSSSGALQLTDRSINSGIYNLESDFGMQAYYLRKNPQGLAYNLKAAVSTGQGRNWTRSKDNGLAYTGRIELYPLGSFTNDAELNEGDLLREPRPKLYLGSSYHYNHKAHKSGGQTGEVLFETKDLYAVFVDAVLKYKGWALMSSYMNRRSSDPLAVDPTQPLNFNYALVGQGVDVQASYLLPKQWELIARYSANVPHKEIYLYTPKQKQYTLGLTKYLKQHSLKAQLEMGMNDYQYFDHTQKENLYVRLQLEIGI